ncbi:hypothetical protein BJX68DRAFT_228624 [Aspergillus pseudodeflectus]|uniref:Uncharacterized protein n=1 Tax=Aspergillus pseudodeflectus TaxID=176178 RepID=A0ABR4L1K2_9EURO
MRRTEVCGRCLLHWLSQEKSGRDPCQAEAGVQDEASPDRRPEWSAFLTSSAHNAPICHKHILIVFRGGARRVEDRDRNP